MVVTRQHAVAHGLERLLFPAGGIDQRLPAVGSSTPVMLRADGWHAFAPLSVPVVADGEEVMEFSLPDGSCVPVVRAHDGVLHPPFDLEDAYSGLVTESWTGDTKNRHLSPRQLGLFYRSRRVLPRPAQLALRRALVRWQGQPAFPTWPVDDSVGRLVELFAAVRLSQRGAMEVAFPWFWPAPYGAALILSHDVESARGIRLAVDLADLEESLGFRSAFNFGAWYDVDPGVLSELRDRGFEVGMHGIVHDRSLFSSRQEFERQLPLLRAQAEELGAVGFRSPATHRRFEWLGELPVEYDGTIPHSDPYEPQPGGCCSLWPFFIGDVVELPYTLPQDHTLLTLLGHRTPAVWVDAAEQIEKRCGLIHCVSHPDPGYLGDRAKLDVYREFLRAMADRPAVWRALPRDVAAWWRRRDLGGDDTDIVHGRIETDALGTAASLIPASTALSV